MVVLLNGQYRLGKVAHTIQPMEVVLILIQGHPYLLCLITVHLNGGEILRLLIKQHAVTTMPVTTYKLTKAH